MCPIDHGDLYEHNVMFVGPLALADSLAPVRPPT